MSWSTVMTDPEMEEWADGALKAGPIISEPIGSEAPRQNPRAAIRKVRVSV